MSDLESVKAVLKKGCFCHSSDVAYMFECMPQHIYHGTLESDCSNASYCYHSKEGMIKDKLLQFQKFLETQGRFKVGDRVELAETPIINEKVSYGWLSDKHFLVEGATGTVQEVSYHHGQFGYDISIDNESWKDSEGRLHPRSDKRCTVDDCTSTHSIHVFYFAEHKLRPVAKERCTFLSRLWNEFYRKGD